MMKPDSSQRRLWAYQPLSKMSQEGILTLVARVHRNFASRLRPYGSVDEPGTTSASSSSRVSSFVDIVCAFPDSFAVQDEICQSFAMMGKGF